MGPPRRAVAVFDTNVLVSAVGWRGAPHRLYRRCRSQHLQPAVSPELIGEPGRVLAYPKLDLREADIEAFVGDVLYHARVVEPTVREAVIDEDPDRNRVLECAWEAGTRWIASGDAHTRGLGGFSGIVICSPDELLRRPGG